MELTPDTVAIYCRRALSNMATTLDRFDDTSVNRRPHGPSTNSAAALVVHSCAAATFWFEHVGLGRPTERDRDTEFVAHATMDELRALIAATIDRLDTLARELDAGPTARDNEIRAFLADGDRSDGSLVLYALHELYQHLGHLELTADALTTRAQPDHD